MERQARGDHGRGDRQDLGTARAQYHLRQVFVFLDVYAINQPEEMIGDAAERFDARGDLRDETSKNLIRQLLQNLVSLTARLRADGEAAGSGPSLVVVGAPPHPTSQTDRPVRHA